MFNFLLGFGCCAALCFGWYHGSLKPKFDEMKQKVEDQFAAWGSGRDFALTAMHLGKSAREAVEIACLFENGCGNGVDVLTPNV